MLKILLQLVLWTVFMAALILWPAGTLAYPGAWAFRRRSLTYDDSKVAVDALVNATTAGLAAICCAAPVVVAAIGAAGSTAWLADTGHVLVPAQILCAGFAGFALYRKQGRER